MVSVFINELHYDNTGEDTGEFIEIAGPASTDLAGWSLVFYNGNGGSVYNSFSLVGTIPDQGNGFGALAFSNFSSPIQNGSPDGIALVDDSGTLVQFLSYEGSFTAVGGPADGLTSIDIGVSESSSTPVGFSLQLTGTGTEFSDFTFNTPAVDSPGQINASQSFGGGGGPATNIIINEIDADQDSTDSAEFIELFDGGVGNTALDGLVLVLFNGSNDQVYNAIDLDGLSTDANGYFVVGSANVPNVDLVAFTTNGLQNGADAVALFNGSDLDFPDGTAVTTSNLIDAIVYDTNDADDAGLLPLLNANQPQVNEAGGANGSTGDSLQRILNGSGGGRNTENYVALAPTPGTENVTPLVQSVTIPNIQGPGHTSPFLGELVSTTGIVTAVDSNGFYLQDAIGDGDIATSDAIFVFTGSIPGANVGDELNVEGTVSEFTPGGTSSRNLSTTQISGNPTLTTLSTGNALPAATVIGTGGRIPPSMTIDDDAFGTFDPVNDGIDFFESLEGMRVTAEDLQVVNGTNSFGEIFAVTNQGASATGLSNRGTLNISPDDFNPEKIQIDEDTDILPGFEIPTVDVGASLGDVTGVVSYGFGNFEILPTEAFSVASNSSLTGETTNLIGSDNQLTIASYNALNLDPNDGDGDTDIANGRFDAIAQQIVNNLGNPDIIGLQEIQDNSGSTNDGTTDADVTLQTLIDAISDAGGPTYAFIDNTDIGNNLSGGQPGGNIRTAFLYNPNRVTPSNVQTIGNQDPGSPFNGARLPLVATFDFNGEAVTVVNNHFSSKGGSAPILGVEQDFAARQEDPTVNGSLDERREQAQAVNNFVDGLLVNDENVVVLGDLNEFEFVSPLGILEGTIESANDGQDTVPGGAAILANLVNTLPEDERYSFIFQGNSQQLDHVLISNSLQANAEVDVVHVNVEFADSDARASDHDPVVSRFTFALPITELTGTNRRDILTGTEGPDLILGRGGRDGITGNGGNDTLLGGRGNDVISGGVGDDVINGGRGWDTLTGGEGSDTFVYERLADRRDQITDFDVSTDTIDISQILDNQRYGSQTPFDDYVQLVRLGNSTAVQVDLSGDFGQRDIFRTLTVLAGIGAVELTMDNFKL